MAKLLFGIIYSLKNLLDKLGSQDALNNLRSFSTALYQVHFFESLTNYKFVLVSDLATESLQPQLWLLYSNIFAKQIVSNPLMPAEFGELKLSNSSFILASDNYLRSLPAFH